MKIMYVAPRYHTNQTAIMKGWVENGHEVCFLSQYAGKLEDYSYCTPHIIGYSRLFHILEAVLKKKRDGDGTLGEFRLKCGFPPFGSIAKQIKKFQPDAVILRERSVYSICAYLACQRQHCPAILYNQSPLWEREIKNDFAHRLVKVLTPKLRITPVLGEESKHPNREENAYYVPFVMEPRISPENKHYFEENLIHIFCIGKYEKRKNHRMMIEIAEELGKRYSVRLTIAGECTSEAHREYYSMLEAYITGHGLEEQVRLLKNLTREEVDAVYEKSDLFVIPSTLEPASISQLEAMAFSLPVICSDTNGTACYVESGRNGYRFRDNDKTDLKDKIEACICEQVKAKQMGRESYFDVVNKYCFEKYSSRISELIKRA